jgi:hypothetical protein
VTRAEARVVVAAALLMLTGALVWLYGPWGLLAAGGALLVLVLFVVNVKESVDGEAVADAGWPANQRGRAVHRP